MDLGGLDGTTLAIVGAVLVVALVAWMLVRSRASAPPPKASEEATKKLYEEEDREHRGESDNVP